MHDRFSVLKKKFLRVRAGMDSFSECLLFFWEYFLWRCKKNRPQYFSPDLANAWAVRRRKRTFCKGEYYSFKDAKIPLLDPENEKIFLEGYFLNVFFPYCFLNDCYDESLIAPYEALHADFYGVKNQRVDVRVLPGDIVIDAGSWIGDFAAYASAKGATVYAFEPTKYIFDYLLKTAKLNKNIFPFMQALGDTNGVMELIADPNNSMGNTLVGEGEKDQIEITTIDEFVEKNGIPRIDFIKASVQGYETKVLLGAKKVLREFSPKLALFYNYYYYPDMPDFDDELEAIIKEANPSYNVVRKRRKLFASVSDSDSK